TFNIALLFAIAALSAMVPLQRNDEQNFPKYTVETGTAGNVLKWSGTNIKVLFETKGKFNNRTDPNLPLKLWDTATDLLPWATSKIYGYPGGPNQYVTSGFYDFQAAVLYTYNAKKTIVPSYYWLYECYPRTLDPATQIFSGTTVLDWQYIVFVPGVVDEACYGTTASVVRECRTNCPGSGSGTVAANTYGKDLWQSYGGTIGRKSIKARISNFGPLLDNYGRLFYGWSDNDETQGITTFLTLKRDGRVLTDVPVILNNTDSIISYYVAYQSIDCTKALATTTTEECPCPAESDAAYKTDPRHADASGICYVPPKVVVTASGATRAAWTVIATVLLLPLLSMW
ncbi:MAG: hypothetical protein EZS28_049522, partial [Streblomastix strix]